MGNNLYLCQRYHLLLMGRIAQAWKKVEYYAVYGVVWLVGSIPFAVLYALSDVIYYPFYYLVRYRRRIVRRNLTEAFPEKSLREIETIERKFYHFFLDVALETCKLATISDADIQRRMPFAGVDYIHNLFAEGHSVAVFLGHYGNWEWISSTGLWLPETHVAQIYRPQSNATMDAVLMTIRQKKGNECVARNEVVRYMSRGKAEGIQHIIGFIADQTPKKRESKVFLPFLNHLTPVLMGTEKVTRHFGYAAMFISCRRVRRGYYDCAFVPLCDDPRSLPEVELTKRYYHLFEQQILSQPECYLWTHNRFRNATVISHNDD